MKKKLCIIMIILTFLPSLIMPLRAYAGTTFREASIEAFEGTVKVIISGGQKQYNAYEGMGLTQGDTVITSEGASATLYIDDDKEIKLGENSRLTLSELSDYIDSQSKSTGLKLWAGKIFVDIKKKLNIRSKFEITTGSTVMGVKGTQFYAACRPRVGDGAGSSSQTGGTSTPLAFTTELVVLHGTVSTALYTAPQNLNQGPLNYLGTVDVHANEGFTFNPEATIAEPPKVEKVKAEQLDLMVLKVIADNPEVYDPNLLKGIDKLIEEKTKEAELEKKKREAEEADKEAHRVTPTPIYLEDEKDTPTQAPTPTATMRSEPIATPTPTISPTPTIAPRPSISPTPTISPRPSVSPTATISPTPSVSPTATISPTPSVSPTATISPTPSVSPTPSISPSGPTAPSPIPGNETVSIHYPTSDTIVNTKQGVTIELMPTNYDNDLQRVKVSVRYGQQGNYLSSASGDFSSSTPVYMDVAMDGSQGYLHLNGNPFSVQGEFDCTVTAIAYDGADGTPTTVTFHVDNSMPQLQDSNLSLELYRNAPGQTNPTEAVCEFTEPIKDTAKTNVENAINNAVTSGNVADLNYEWNYDSDQLTVTVDSTASGPILFKDTKNITAEIYDLAGNSNTVTLFSVVSVPTESVSPKFVQVENGSVAEQFYTSTYQYVVPLPNGVGFSNIINDETFNWKDYVSLGGILENKVINTVTESYVGDHPSVVVTVETNPSDNNLYVSGEGEGTITISNRLMTDISAQDGYEVPTTPICAMMIFTTTGLGMSIRAVDGPSCVLLEWEQAIPSSDITVYAATGSAITGSAITGFIQCTDAEVNSNGNAVYINGLEMNTDYWFRLEITGGDYAGYSNVVHYIPGAPDEMELYIEQEKKVQLQFAPDGYHYSLSNWDDSIAHVTLNEEEGTLSVSGAAYGVTHVTVTASPDNGVGENIKYTFNVNVAPLIMVQATPSEMGIFDYYSKWISDTYSFILTLENGTFKENLSNYNPSAYVQLGGALKNNTVSEIKNVEGNPNEIEIILQKQADGQQDYIQVENEEEAKILILHDLWNGSKDLITVILVQVMC